MYIIRAEILKMLVRITYRGDPDQTASESDLGLHCLSWPFCQATSVQNLRTSTVNKFIDQAWLCENSRT